MELPPQAKRSERLATRESIMNEMNRPGSAGNDRRCFGALLLTDLSHFLRRFVVMTEDQAVGIALWVAHTHAFDASDVTPYLTVTSALKRSGKSRLLEVLKLLVFRPLPTANISDAALFRAISQFSPTLLFDEIDAILGPKARDREDLRGMLNAGFERGAVAHRIGGTNRRTLETFDVFAAKAFAGIGELPDTIADRAILIRLERRTRDEPIERFRRRDIEPEASELQDRVAAWIEPQVDYLRSMRPALPDQLDDRAQDIWEPLLAIADFAGRDWPRRARVAAVALSANGAREDDELTARLLRDVRAVFDESGEDRLRTVDLIEQLATIEESPWGDWYGKPITTQALSKLLHPFRIKTMSVWVDGEKGRGYKREQFANAFARVLDGREGRDGRSGSASDTASTASTAPTVPVAPVPLDAPEWERAWWERHPKGAS
jgi:hypothetical protein